MCQSKAAGGKRCTEHTATTARRVLRKKISRWETLGKDTTALIQQVDDLDAAREQYGSFVSPMEMNVPGSVEEVLDTLQAQGYTALIVGGSVRDVLSGETPKDFDIEVYGVTIDEVATVMRRSGYPVDEVGKAFGVLKARTRDGEDLDVSVPRQDSLSGAGHRGFTVTQDSNLTVVEAAQRRDFTINAMMYDHKLKALVDPYGGADDYAERKLRHVSDAFGEDPLRPLRGFQFVSRLGLDLAPSTAQLSRSLASRYDELPTERVRGEWMKFYTKGNYPSKGAQALQDMGWDEKIPGAKALSSEHVRQRLDNSVSLSQNAQLNGQQRAALMASHVADELGEAQAPAFLSATLENKEMRRQALTLAQVKVPAEHDDTAVRKIASALGAGNTNLQMATLKLRAEGADQQAAALESSAHRLGVWESPQPSILMGRHILEKVDKTPGPWLGQLTRNAYAAQENGEFFDMDGAYKWLAKQEV